MTNGAAVCLVYYTAEISCSDGWDIPLIDYTMSSDLALNTQKKPNITYP